PNVKITSLPGRLLRSNARTVEALHRFTGRLLARARPEWNHRAWSNDELRRWGGLFKGDVINVSGWHDEDKHGGRYRDYFPHGTSYTISNIGGSRGATGKPEEIFLDLTAPLAAELHARFDVVFNHTVLEHIFDIRTAVMNLCLLSRDIVIIVVPFRQQVHFDAGSFLDYWRPTPFALSSLLGESGFEVVYCTNNDNPVYSTYTFCIASSQPQKWRDVFPRSYGVDLISGTTVPASE
ncbi:MAG TPA: hypothetical protein VF911_02085, partial [Thermoanaerobaculia bacterium]